MKCGLRINSNLDVVREAQEKTRKTYRDMVRVFFSQCAKAIR